MLARYSVEIAEELDQGVQKQVLPLRREAHVGAMRYGELRSRARLWQRQKEGDPRWQSVLVLEQQQGNDRERRWHERWLERHTGQWRGTHCRGSAVQDYVKSTLSGCMAASSATGVQPHQPTRRYRACPKRPM